MQPIPLKIAYIGGGSREWARKLMFDLALSPELTGEVALFDIDQNSAQLNEKLGTWLQEQPGVVSKWKYRAVATLKEALQSADFVVISIQPGKLEVMAEEIALAEQYGLFFPVGDTTGAPGLIRGLRAATAYAGFAEAIAEICPNAWIINYSNPMAICTRTLTRVAPGLKVFGCCHEVFSTQRMFARLVGQYLTDGIVPERDEIQVNVLGINHFTWVDQALYNGQDLFPVLTHHLEQPGVLRTYTREEVESRDDWFYSADQVKFACYQRFGILAAAGDRHLVEFLPGFIQSLDHLYRWGVLRTPVSWRIQRWQAAPQRTLDLISGKTALNLISSGEEGVGQIKALVGLGNLVTNVNLPNRGQIANLPLDCVVETNAYFHRDKVEPLTAGSLPSNLASFVARHSANQELIVEAALRRDKDLAFQAFYLDPSNPLPLDSAWNLYNQMLFASRNDLPGWNFIA